MTVVAGRVVEQRFGALISFTMQSYEKFRLVLHFSATTFSVFRQFVLPRALFPPLPRLSQLARGFEEDYSALSAHSNSHLSRLQLSSIGRVFLNTEAQRHREYCRASPVTLKK